MNGPQEISPDVLLKIIGEMHVSIILLNSTIQKAQKENTELREKIKEKEDGSISRGNG